MESRDIRENREKRRRFEAKNVEDEDTWGPYVENVRATMLRKLLYAQYEIQQEQGETLQLISHQELIAIQVIWYREGLFRNSVADIYNSIFNTHIDMSKRVLKMREEEQLLREICVDQPDHFDLIQRAVKLVKSKSIMVKKRGMQNDIENLLDNYIDRKELSDKKLVTI
jgi:DNA sulfur modification protein DndC